MMKTWPILSLSIPYKSEPSRPHFLYLQKVEIRLQLLSPPFSPFSALPVAAAAAAAVVAAAAADVTDVEASTSP